MADNPFPDVVVVDWSFLDKSSRNPCPKCKKSRKFYCYTCCLPLPNLVSLLPKVKLPVKIDIIKHPNETDGKSTAPHAVILAPEDVAIYTYPCIPDYDADKVVLVFPGEESLTLEELSASCVRTLSEHYCLAANDEQLNGSSEILLTGQNCGQLPDPTAADTSCHTENQVEKNATASQNSTATRDEVTESLPSCRLSAENQTTDKDSHEGESLAKKFKLSPPLLPIEKVVFIDATWNQTHNIVSDERLKNLRKVELKARHSHFWRHQEGTPPTYLSTIEAIYYFMKDFHCIYVTPVYNHQYDNLLFFFCYMRQQITQSHAERRSHKTKQEFL